VAGARRQITAAFSKSVSLALAGEQAIRSGCRLMSQCGTRWYVIAYDASSTTAALVEETDVAGQYLLFGNPEPVLRTLLLSFAAKEMHEAQGP
jgi:hypothetical protein